MPLYLPSGGEKEKRTVRGEDAGFALNVRDQLDALSDEDWWAYKFFLHPNVFTFVHPRLV